MGANPAQSNRPHITSFPTTPLHPAIHNRAITSVSAVEYPVRLSRNILRWTRFELRTHGDGSGPLRRSLDTGTAYRFLSGTFLSPYLTRTSKEIQAFFTSPLNNCSILHMARLPRAKPLSEDLRWVLVHMRHHRNLTINEIVSQTGLKKRTVQRFFEVFYKQVMWNLFQSVEAATRDFGWTISW